MNKIVRKKNKQDRRILTTDETDKQSCPHGFNSTDCSLGSISNALSAGPFRNHPAMMSSNLGSRIRNGHECLIIKYLVVRKRKTG